MAPSLYFFLFTLLPALSLGNSIKIPPSFPDRSLGSYQIRYLSESAGFDEERCLLDQSLAPASTISACRSLPFVLTGQIPGERTAARVSNLSKVIILIAPGKYSFKGEINVMDSNSVIVAKDPTQDGEVVFSCSSLETRFNNFYFLRVEHVALIGVTSSKCGLIVGSVSFELCRNVIVNDCVFR